MYFYAENEGLFLRYMKNYLVIMNVLHRNHKVFLICTPFTNYRKTTGKNW